MQEQFLRFRQKQMRINAHVYREDGPFVLICSNLYVRHLSDFTFYTINISIDVKVKHSSLKQHRLMFAATRGKYNSSHSIVSYWSCCMSNVIANSCHFTKKTQSNTENNSELDSAVLVSANSTQLLIFPFGAKQVGLFELLNWKQLVGEWAEWAWTKTVNLWLQNQNNGLKDVKTLSRAEGQADYRWTLLRCT